MRAVPTQSGYEMVVLGDDDIVSKGIASLGYWEISDPGAMASNAGITLPKNGTFLDIGANLGYYSLLFAHKGYKVIAVEPMTRNRQAIEASLCLNPALKALVTVVAAALVAPEEVEGTRCVVKSTNEAINVGNGYLTCGVSNEVEPCAVGNGNCEEVPVETLDTALAKVNPTSVDVVKMDVESYECKVFAGGQSLFQKYHPKLLQVETMYGNSKQCVQAEAAKYAYRTLPAGENTHMTPNTVFLMMSSHTSA